MVFLTLGFSVVMLNVAPSMAFNNHSFESDG